METENPPSTPPALIPPRFVRFFKFCAVGLLNLSVGYLIYSTLVWLGLHYIAANVVSFIIGVQISFFLNGKFVFRHKSKNLRDTARAMLKTYASYLFSLVAGNVLLYVFVDVLGISKYLAPLFVQPIVAPLNYTLIRRWAFKQRE